MRNDFSLCAVLLFLNSVWRIFLNKPLLLNLWKRNRTVIKIRNILFIIFSFGMTLLLAGCKAVVLNPAGPVAAQEKHLFLTEVILMLIIVVPVIIFTLVIARRYRESNEKAKYTPDWCHSNKLEAIWWAIPIVLIAVLGVLAWKTTHELNPYKKLSGSQLVTVKPGTKTLHIEAIALRWRWLFIYPAQHIATINDVRFPAHTQIAFKLTSDAPMNSFQIQQLAGQIYTMNGMTTELHLLATRTGTFRGRSVSFSGAGFANMYFHAEATTQKQFKQWVAKVRTSPTQLTVAEYNKLSQPTRDIKPAYFSSPTPHLFQKVIQSFLNANQQAAEARKTPVVEL